MTELACPEVCPFLQEARASAGGRRAERFIAHLLTTENRELLEAARRLEPLIYLCEGALVKAQREQFRDLTDQEVLDAVESVMQTAETMEKGIIYTHKPQSPRAQAVAEVIHDTLDDFKRKLSEQGPGVALSDGDVTNCLRLMVEWIKLEMGPKGRTYLRQSALFHPYPESQPSLIVAP